MAERKKEGVVVPDSQKAPYDRSNLFLTRDQFIEKERLRKEKLAKLNKYAKEIDEDNAAKVIPVGKDNSPKKRPKKIDK